jgi:hypothetical protein
VRKHHDAALNELLGRQRQKGQDAGKAVIHAIEAFASPRSTQAFANFQLTNPEPQILPHEAKARSSPEAK